MKLKKYKLGDLVEVTRGTSLPGIKYSEVGNRVRLTLGNFNYNGGGFKENTSKTDIYYTGEVKDEYILNKGDIITPLTEQTPGLLGTTAMIPQSNKYIQSQDIALIKCKKDKIDNLFCYYLISSSIVKKQLSAAAQQTKIRHTSPDKIKECVVWIPDSLKEQASIGKMLYSLDRKIELNTRLISELEATAKQLYEYWFVQFDFPDENGKPYKSSGGKMVWNEQLKREIPEGWEVRIIGDILDKYPNTKRFDTKEYLTIGEYPIIDQGDTYIAGFTNDIQNCLKRFPAVLFGDHSTKIKFLNFPFCRGADGTQILYSNDTKIKAYYLYSFLLNLYIPNPGYSRHFKYIKESSILAPKQEFADKFEAIVCPIYSELTKKIWDSIYLTRLRDSLLPLLMNGQVKVE